MRQPIDPIEADFTDYESYGHTLPNRPYRDGCLYAPRHNVVRSGRDNRQRSRQQQTRNQTIDEVVAQILPEAFSKELVLAHREQVFERYEQQAEKQKPNGKPPDLPKDSLKMNWV